MLRCWITISEVTHELFKHHSTWCPKIPLKKFMKTFSWCLDAEKLKTEQKLIVVSCLYCSLYLFRRKIGTQSHSAKFLNWGGHVNSVPDLAASPPPPPPRLLASYFRSYLFEKNIFISDLLTKLVCDICYNARKINSFTRKGQFIKSGNFSISQGKLDYFKEVRGRWHISAYSPKLNIFHQQDIVSRY